MSWNCYLLQHQRYRPFLLTSPPSFRRDFEKAIRSRFGKGFGRNEKELRQAFDSMDLDGSGGIGLNEIKVLFKLLYPMLPDEDPIYTQALQSLDLEDNGSISFDEFKKILLSS